MILERVKMKFDPDKKFAIEKYLRNLSDKIPKNDRWDDETNMQPIFQREEDMLKYIKEDGIKKQFDLTNQILALNLNAKPKKQI